MYDLSRFGRIFMMDFTAGSSLVFETGMCRKRWWYLVEYGTEHLILCAGVMVCAWTDLKYGKVRNYWLWLLTVAGVLHRGSAFFFGAVLFLAAGMCLFRFRVMGAGDGKLMAVIGGYLGAGILRDSAGVFDRSRMEPVENETLRCGSRAV